MNWLAGNIHKILQLRTHFLYETPYIGRFFLSRVSDIEEEGFLPNVIMSFSKLVTPLHVKCLILTCRKDTCDG